MPPPPGPLHLRAAVGALLDGGVIACPTEAVWGLSCAPADSAAVRRLLRLKSRPVDKGLILVAADLQQFAAIVEDLPASQHATLEHSWPGPCTWLVPHRGRVPAWISGAHDTVALRVSAHPLVAALCRGFGGPLVSTSANPGGAQPARAGYQVRRYFGGDLDYILPGALGGSGRPSVIRDLASGRVIRA